MLLKTFSSSAATGVGLCVCVEYFFSLVRLLDWLAGSVFEPVLVRRLETGAGDWLALNLLNASTDSGSIR